MTRAHVDEVNVHAIDRRDELWQGVELRFGLAPVVVRPPVAHELLELRERHALRGVVDGLALGPARGRNAPTEVDEGLVRHGDVERTHGGVVGRTRRGGAVGRRTRRCGVLRAHGSRRGETRDGRQEYDKASRGQAAGLRGSCGDPHAASGGE